MRVKGYYSVGQDHQNDHYNIDTQVRTVEDVDELMKFLKAIRKTLSQKGGTHD